MEGRLSCEYFAQVAHITLHNMCSMYMLTTLYMSWQLQSGSLHAEHQCAYAHLTIKYCKPVKLHMLKTATTGIVKFDIDKISNFTIPVVAIF